MKWSKIQGQKPQNFLQWFGVFFVLIFAIIIFPIAFIYISIGAAWKLNLAFMYNFTHEKGE